MIPDVNSSQGKGELPKTSASNHEKIASHGDATASEIVGNLLSNSKGSTNIHPIERHDIPPATEEETSVGEIVKNVNKPSDEWIKTSLTREQVLKIYTANQLFHAKDQDLGREKLMEDIHHFPGQLEKDLHRLGNVTIGDVTREPSYFEPYAMNKKDQIHRYLSGHLGGYIKDNNPNLNLQPEKIEEILRSATQTISNDLLNRRMDKLQQNPWGFSGDPEKSKMETSFKLERTFITYPEVLTVSRKLTKELVNTDDPTVKPKIVTMDARVIHNLRTNKIDYEYELTVKEKGAWLSEYHEVWDPTKEIPPK